MSDRYQDTQMADLVTQHNMRHPPTKGSWVRLWLKVVLATSSPPALALLIYYVAGKYLFTS